MFMLNQGSWFPCSLLLSHYSSRLFPTMVVEFETVNFFLFSLASRAWCFFIQLFIESCVLPYYTVDGMISPHSRRWEQIVDDISTYQQIVLSKDGDGESQLRDIQTKCTEWVFRWCLTYSGH